MGDSCRFVYLRCLLNNRTWIYYTLNGAAIVVCIFFFVLLYALQRYDHIWCFIVAGTIFSANMYFISRGRFDIGFSVFSITATLLMLIFDSGYMSETRSTIMYVPIILANYTLGRYEHRYLRYPVLIFTLVSIYLTNFTHLTPGLSHLIHGDVNARYIALFNVISGIAVSMYILRNVIKVSDEATTELKAERDKIKQQQQLLDSINQNISEGIYRIDKDLRIVYVNKAFASILGYTVPEMYGRLPDILFNCDQQRERLANLVRKNGCFSNEEIQVRKKDGSIIPVLVSTNLRVYENERYYDGSLRDITRIKAIQQELIEAKEGAERAALAQSKFLSVMSHEIRTPMNAVIGISNLLLHDNPKKEQVEDLNMLHFSATNLLGLINNILDLNKIESDKLELEEMSFNPDELCRDITESFRTEALVKKIRISYHNTSDIKPYVLADGFRFQQVLTNLVSNAIKFTEEGHVQVRLHTSETADGFIQVKTEVIDTGIGIEAEQIPRLFNVFEQANRTTARKFGGSGLGLSIAKKLIDLMGGTISLESRAGEGSCFTILLTMKKSSRENGPEQPMAVSEDHPLLNGMRVLIAEDNPVNVIILQKFLVKWNAISEVATNGAEAEEMVRLQSYDMILMDLHMPEKDGYEATRAIRQAGYMMPVLALTADAFEQTRERALAAGMNDFITKPFNPEQLLNKLVQYRQISDKS